MEKFILVGDTALRYADSEKGDKVVVLLHGYLESLEVWEDFSKLLRKEGFRTITLDLPGHGVSEVLGEVHTMEFLADIVKQLLDKIGVKRCTVIGHSMGGYVALAFAKKYGDMLDGVVLFHSTPNADTDEKKANRLREIELIKAGRKELLSTTFPQKAFALENRKRLADAIDEQSLQVMLTEDEGIIAILRGMMEREDMNDMLKSLKVPQLFIFGRKDEYISSETAEEIIAKNPQAKVAWLENSAHIGFVEEPTASVKIIADFVTDKL